MAINVVSNAGPLMVFSKLNVLHLLKGLYGRVEFPLSVYRETVSVGIRRGFTDAQVLNSFLMQNGLEVIISVGFDRYVFIHELCHTIHMNHSQKYWAFLASREPEYVSLDKELRGAWRVVPPWVG
jgi:hypothetical protein